MKLSAYLLVSASPLVAISAFASPVSAQTADAEQADAEGYDDDEILVTAQRRTERARDVPISLTTLGEDQLVAAGVLDTRGLTILTPGLKIDRVGNFTLPAIRGVSTTITTPGADPNVAIYLDGIYQPSTLTNTFDLPDVERVEILKGPQGTLFGRNATGGAIQVITRAPTYTPEGMASIGYGSFNTVTARAFVSVPLVEDRVALSVAGFYENGDSYYNNLRSDGPDLEGAESTLVRAKLRLDPAENIRIQLTGRYSERQESLAIYGNPLNGNTVTRVLDPNAIIPTRPFDVAFNNEARPQSVKAADGSLRIEIDTATGTFNSLTGYVHADTSNVLDADYSFAPNGLGVNFFVTVFDRYLTQELTYSSDYSGPLNFIVGTFYSKGRSGWNPLGVQTPAFGISIFGEQRIESLAGFGEIYYDLTERLSLIGGLRYSWEERSLNSALGFGSVTLPTPALTNRGSESWDSITPRLSLRYAINPVANVYFTFSQGFKSGVYNTNAQRADLADPETITAYELGFKGRISDDLSLDLAGFYYDYKDLQATVYINLNGVPTGSLLNAASARIYGLEGDATMNFSENFNVRAAFSILDAQYGDFSNAAILAPCTNIPVSGPCNTIGTPTLTGNTTIAFDASGQGMVRAPNFTASVTANGNVDIAGGQLDVSSTLYYSSRLNFTFDHRVHQPNYLTLDARIAWSPNNSGFTIAAFGRNLTDQTVISGTFIADPADGVSYAPPRTYGVAVEYRF